jgi:hypothetical protein
MLLSVYHHVPFAMFRSAEALNPTNVRNPCEEKGTNHDAKGDDCGKKIVQHCLFSCSALSRTFGGDSSLGAVTRIKMHSERASRRQFLMVST